MGVLERNSNEKTFVSTVGIILLLGLCLLIGFLIFRASELSNNISITNEIVGLGPLEFFELNKQPLETGGFEASIGLRAGLIIYFLFLLTISLLIAKFATTKKNEKPEQTKLNY